jgi:hypothetical protein
MKYVVCKTLTQVLHRGLSEKASLTFPRIVEVKQWGEFVPVTRGNN